MCSLSAGSYLVTAGETKRYLWCCFTIKAVKLLSNSFIVKKLEEIKRCCYWIHFVSGTHRDKHHCLQSHLQTGRPTNPCRTRTTTLLMATGYISGSTGDWTQDLLRVKQTWWPLHYRTSIHQLHLICKSSNSDGWAGGVKHQCGNNCGAVCSLNRVVIRFIIEEQLQVSDCETQHFHFVLRAKTWCCCQEPELNLVKKM